MIFPGTTCQAMLIFIAKFHNRRNTKNRSKLRERTHFYSYVDNECVKNVKMRICFT